MVINCTSNGFATYYGSLECNGKQINNRGIKIIVTVLSTADHYGDLDKIRAKILKCMLQTFI
jgi:deoxyhypusine synthase